MTRKPFLSIPLSGRFVPILSFDFKKTGFSRDGYLCSGKRFGANVKHFLMNGSGKKVFLLILRSLFGGAVGNVGANN